MEQLKENAKKLYNAGLAHIFGSSFLNKVLFFCGNVIVVRVLTKEEFGTFGFADSIMAFVINFSGLGMATGVLQFCSQKRPEAEKRAFASFGLKFGIFATIGICIIAFIYGLLGPFAIPKAKMVFLIYAFYPIPYFIYYYNNAVLRCNKENKKYALLTNVNASVYVISAIIFTVILREIGLVVAGYTSMLLSSFLGRYYVKKYGFKKEPLPINGKQKKAMIKYSFYSFSSNIMTNVLIIMDIFLIGVLIAEPTDIATYKIATAIPLALMIIPNSIVVFVYPYFAENQNNYKWVKENTKKLITASAGLNAVVTIMLILLAPYIIKILWGESYLDAVLPFRILSVNYFVQSTLRFNIINLMGALNKAEIVFRVNFIAMIINIILDVLFIYKFGILGAAIATLLTVIVTSLILVPTFIKHLKVLKGKMI